MLNTQIFALDLCRKSTISETQTLFYCYTLVTIGMRTYKACCDHRCDDCTVTCGGGSVCKQLLSLQIEARNLSCKLPYFEDNSKLGID